MHRLTPLWLALYVPSFAADPLDLDAHNLHPAAQDGDLRGSMWVHRPTAFEARTWFAGALLEFT